MIQLDLFRSPEECEILALKDQCQKTTASADKVRKGIFARHNVLDKRMDELERRLGILEKGIVSM